MLAFIVLFFHIQILSFKKQKTARWLRFNPQITFCTIKRMLSGSFVTYTSLPVHSCLCYPNAKIHLSDPLYISFIHIVKLITDFHIFCADACRENIFLLFSYHLDPVLPALLPFEFLPYLFYFGFLPEIPDFYRHCTETKSQVSQ